MKKPTPILIVAGLGNLPEICSAAAIALRRFPHADVAFASKAALPDVLEARAPASGGAVHLLGVGLTRQLRTVWVENGGARYQIGLNRDFRAVCRPLLAILSSLLCSSCVRGTL
jgi:hypothetical protein